MTLSHITRINNDAFILQPVRETEVSFLSFQTRRSVMSQSKMALPMRTRSKHFLKLIQKFNSPTRFLCAASRTEIKVRESAKGRCLFDGDVSD